MSDVEEIIKEVLVLTGSKKKDKTDVQKDIIAEKKRKLQDKYETHVDRIYEKRSKSDDEDFSSLNRIKNVIEQFTSSSNLTDHKIQTQNSSKIISEIKTKLFDEKSIVGDDLEYGEIKIKKMNNSILSEKISPNSLKENLLDSNQDYNDYAQYMATLKSVIEEVKNSDEPNKHELVLSLIKEKSVANNEMNLILSEFLTEVTKNSVEFVTKEYAKEINELHEFGQYEDVDSLIGDKLASIEDLKNARIVMKNNVGYMIKQLSETSNLVNKTLSSAGTLYLTETKEIEEELRHYANENNIPLTTDIAIKKNDKVIKTLQDGYGLVKEDITGLISASNNTIHKLVELLSKDEEIIEKQDDVIETLMTQRTKKIITVDNLLQTKLSVIAGPDGTGKSHTAINMAMTESKMHKTLLVDLNIYNPNVVYYNNTSESTENRRWFNNQTITLEEFIHIPISKYMYQELPFKNNLTIIQPKDVINLEIYETIVNPSVFSLHIMYFLENLSQFYDKIIVVLPENIDNFGDLMTKVGTMFLVNDYDPNNIKKLNKFTSKHEGVIDDIPIKYIIMNKKSRNVKTSIKEYLEQCNIDTRDFKYFTIPAFQESTQNKIDGKIPSEYNVNTRKLFEELTKR